MIKVTLYNKNLNTIKKTNLVKNSKLLVIILLLTILLIPQQVFCMETLHQAIIKVDDNDEVSAREIITFITNRANPEELQEMMEYIQDHPIHNPEGTLVINETLNIENAGNVPVQESSKITKYIFIGGAVITAVCLIWYFRHELQDLFIQMTTASVDHLRGRVVILFMKAYENDPVAARLLLAYLKQRYGHHIMDL